jgi:AcrR family transcriptional regulator
MADVRGTRNRLLEAAIELIAERGEAGLKVDEVAERAEITKPSLYHFFGDREGLVVAAQAERFRRSLRFGQDAALQLAQACTSRADFEALIMGGLTQFADSAAVLRRRARIDVLGSAVSRPELMAEVNQVLTDAANDLGELVDIGKERGWVSSPFSSRSLAMWWYGTLLGRYLVESNDAFDVAEWDGIMVATMRNLLFA